MQEQRRKSGAGTPAASTEKAIESLGGRTALDLDRAGGGPPPGDLEGLGIRGRPPRRSCRSAWSAAGCLSLAPRCCACSTAHTHPSRPSSRSGAPAEQRSLAVASSRDPVPHNHGGLRARGGLLRAGRTRPGLRVHASHWATASGGSRPGGGSSRRVRAGTRRRRHHRPRRGCPELAGQQYAARSDVLRVLLGRLSPGSPRIEGQLGEATLRDVLDRWEDRGLVARDRLLGHPWVAPTAKAPRLVGLDVRAWSFVIPQLAHVHAVGVVRLALEPSIPPGGRWLSERELRREVGKSHVPDAAIQPRRPRPRRRRRLVRRGRRPTPEADRGRGRADPQRRRPAARGLDPTSPWPLAAHLLLRPA